MTDATDYDVLVVGARCAGAALATYLARAGASVLLLDRATLPSDQVLSTHTIHPPGMDVLDELGVGDAVRRHAPPSRIMRLRKNDAFVDIRFANGRAEHCPRRKRLDQLLQDAAQAAGARLLDRTRVSALLWNGNRVAGVRATGPDGGERAFRASLVVGADGRHSTVAAQVHAEEYLAYDAPRAMYWGYWDAPSRWTTDGEYGFDMYVGNTAGDIRVVFQTDDGQLLIGSLPTVEEAAAWRGDPDGALTRDIVSDPMLAPLVEGSRRDGSVRGTLKERYFFRRAAGPGWALVGDAGHHKEFVIGDGITEALLQTRDLAAAIGRGTDGAIRRWWRARDVKALPLYFFGQDQGAPGPPLRLEQAVYAHVARTPALQVRMAAVPDHRLSPYELISPLLALRLAAGAALRGAPGALLRDFVQMGHRAAAVRKELENRRQLLSAEAAD